MITIDFYTTFEKKTNSTKKPADTAALSIQGDMIMPSSVLHPVFQIKRLAADACPEAYIYAVIPAFERYYFVRDWVWVDGLWEVRLDCDVLASWKTYIGELNEYILRTDSTTTDFNTYISDNAYPATTDFSINESFAVSAFTSDLTTGCYIVGIISGGNSDAVGAISYYAMTSAQFGALKNKLFSDDNLEIMGIIDSGGQALVTDLSQEVLKTLYNPYQYIASCMWFPFPASSITSKTSVTSIKIGWWPYSLSGYLLYAQIIEFGEGIDIHDHPKAATRGKYLNYAPFTRRTLFGRFGTVAIDNSLFADVHGYTGDHLAIGYNIDLITGQCRTTIEIQHYDSGSGNRYYNIIAQRYFLIGVPIQIAQVGTDYLGTVVSAIDTGKAMIGGAMPGLLTGNVLGAVGGALIEGASGIYNTVKTAMPQVETGGANGSFLAPSTRTCLLEQYFEIVDEDITHRGRPLCENRTIKNLSGFILCAEGDHDIPCMLEEKEMISRFLTTGFFWE